MFLNKKTGKEVYIRRTSTPVRALFDSAAEIILKHFVSAGEPAVTGAAADEVTKAAEMLKRALDAEPDWWNALWFLGKSLLGRQWLDPKESASTDKLSRRYTFTNFRG